MSVKSISAGFALGSILNGEPASSLASPPVVSTLLANFQVSSTPTPAGVVAIPSRSAAVTLQSPWNGSYSAAIKIDFDSDGFSDVGSVFGAAFGASLAAGPPASVAEPENWNPAMVPTSRTAAHAAPAFTLDANMAVSTPSVRTMAETDAEPMVMLAAAVDAVSASGTRDGARAAPATSGKPCGVSRFRNRSRARPSRLDSVPSFTPSLRAASGRLRPCNSHRTTGSRYLDGSLWRAASKSGSQSRGGSSAQPVSGKGSTIRSRTPIR